MEEKNTMRFHGSSTYIADDDLLQVTNIAMALGKPLVIKGEPGTGKTELAVAIAESLGMPLITWSIKSTTKAQDTKAPMATGSPTNPSQAENSATPSTATSQHSSGTNDWTQTPIPYLII